MDTTDTEETVTETGSDWAELTQECLINILGRLTLEHGWSAPMLVCKLWLQMCKDPCLNSAFDLERRIDSMLQSVVHWSVGSLKQIRTRHCSNQSFPPQSTAKT
ncbi:hypothetical protein TB2_021790 [Malus domestica]